MIPVAGNQQDCMAVPERIGPHAGDLSAVINTHYAQTGPVRHRNYKTGEVNHGASILPEEGAQAALKASPVANHLTLIVKGPRIGATFERSEVVHGSIPQKRIPL